jgi:hypothetical protein
MIWIKSALVGLAAAFVTIVVIVALVLATAMWHIDVGAGAGGIGFVSFGLGEVLVLPVIFAFALGFWWSVRRERKKRVIRA